MKHLLITLIVLLLPCSVWSAAITSAQTGDWSATATWTGGVVPGDGDTATINSGHTVTVDSTVTVGSNAAAVGHAVTVNGTLTVDSGVTLILKGYDVTSNRAMQIDAGATFAPAAGSTVQVVPTISWQTIINNNGDLIADGVTFESGEPWSFTEQGKTLTSYVQALFKKTSTGNISLFVVGESVAGTKRTYGPISNADETAVGTPLDNSFNVVSVTGGDLTPYNILQTKVSSIDNLLNTGDYYVDCNNGVVYFLDTESKTRLSVTYTVKTHQWLGWGIQSVSNGPSRAIFTNCTFRRLGGKWGSHDSEYTQQAVLLQYRTNGVVNSEREGVVTGCTFEYCILPLQVYNSTNTANDKINLTSNNYLYNPVNTGNWQGSILFGYTSHADVSGSHFNTLCSVSGSILRTPTNGLIYKNLTGQASINSFFGGGYGNLAEGCDMTDVGSFLDGGGFQVSGIDGSPNVWKNNICRYGNRAGRVGPYMTIEGNTFIGYEHHGFTSPASNGFFQGIRIKNNVIGASALTGNMSGGWTLGYNYTQWLDDIEIEGNTFDTGARAIHFNDQEGTYVLGTRLKIWNNNLSNSNYGIYQPPTSENGKTKKQLLRLDYNNEYGFTVASNVKQATFIKGGVEYNLDVARNIPGVALYNPSTVPLAEKTLQLVVSGTPGTDFSMLLSYGGGTAVELVSAQGTATGGTAATTHTTPGTLVDSTKSWTADAIRLDQGKITSGTGAEQVFMVRTNNATTITALPRNAQGTWTAPSTDSVYIVLSSDVQLSDGTNTVEAGIYLPDVPLSTGTYTDTGISAASHAVTVDPGYVDTANYDYRPTNSALESSGIDGGLIGALGVYYTSSSAGAALLMGW